MNKGGIILLLCGILSFRGNAQESASVFNFLKIPLSSHVAALGGENVSLSQDDPTLIFFNPAQAAQVDDKSLSLDYVSYLEDTRIMGAAFTKVFSVRHTVGFTGQILDYGSMDETNEVGDIVGSFSAKDVALSALYSYTMGNGWVGGATARYLFSKYAEYSSSAVAFDLGLHYNNEPKDFSFGIVLRNVGAQLSSFHEGQTEHLPTDLQMGITKQMEHAPFRFSVTMRDMTRWSNHYYYNPKGKNSVGRKFFNHFVFGLDFLPSQNTYIALGFNCRRNNELKAAGAAHGAGWSVGGGLTAKKFKLGLAYAKYHVSTSSLLFNLSYSF
ncbi:MAG: type IX secretion system protein PorQ [Bacteroidaceae bacterium]|nr:type IX secretion system protein PorQ [Bacteroidaceae bacterium]